MMANRGLPAGGEDHVSWERGAWEFTLEVGSCGGDVYQGSD